MSTRSYIGIELKNGKIKYVYCHWDGYLAYNGQILLNNYKSREKVLHLLTFGDISSLGEVIEPLPNKEHSFDGVQQDGVCVFYGRDRGERNVSAKISTKEDFKKSFKESWSEYCYLMTKESKWTYSTDGETFEELTQEAIDNERVE